MTEVSPEIEAIIATPGFQEIMNARGSVLLESGLSRGLSAVAIQAEIDEFALREAQVMLEQG